jgi:hypothetical protein
MTRRTAAGWHTYDDVGELLSELELSNEDMAHARDVTDDHVRAWHLAQVRAEQNRTQEEVTHVMGVRSPAYRLSNEANSMWSPSQPCVPTCAPSAEAFGSWQTSATKSTD